MEQKMKVNLRNLSQEELIKMINEKDKKIEVLTEQLNWYSQQIKLQQKKLLVHHQKKLFFQIRFLFLMK